MEGNSVTRGTNALLGLYRGGVLPMNPGIRIGDEPPVVPGERVVVEPVHRTTEHLASAAVRRMFGKAPNAA